VLNTLVRLVPTNWNAAIAATAISAAIRFDRGCPGVVAPQVYE